MTDALVVGGGIGGLSTALALARTGLSVKVLERAPEFSEVGAGLQVGPNALRALDSLGVLDPVFARAVFPEFGRIANATTGEELTRMSLGAPMVDRFGYPYIVVHRNDVLVALLDACRAHPLIALENDKTVSRIRQRDDQVEVSCEDGTTHAAALCVGADGLHSQVRKLIVDDQPVFSGYVAYRGTVPIDDIPAADRTDDVLLWVGPGLHLMQYPVRSGELYNQVAVFHSLQYAEGRSDWGGPDELLERFAATCEPVRRAASVASRMRAYPNYDKTPIGTYVAGRAVLVGDAAHPMLQYLGQGACQALEDAVSLARLLQGNVGDPLEALTEYDRLRVPRTNRCQTIARQWGTSWHTEDPVLLAYRDRYFRSRSSDEYSDAAWLYDDALTQEERTTGK